MKNIIFLLGVPRSGSTLLQRVLASHQEIHSIAEPWLLLPLLTSLDASFSNSIYSNISLKQALNDLSQEIPDFDKEYELFVKNFVQSQYEKITKDSQFFLDKTPRYYLIADKIRRIFDDAAFIYIFRNPVDIIDSTFNTFCDNRIYKLPYYYFDLMHGLNLLTQSVIKGSGNQILISYEDLCEKPEVTVSKIARLLNLSFDKTDINSFATVDFKGRFGDPNRFSHKGISLQSNNQALSIVKKRLYKKIINNIEDEALLTAGYNRATLLNNIETRKAANIKNQIIDLIDYVAFKLILFIGLTPLNKIFKNNNSLEGYFMS